MEQQTEIAHEAAAGDAPLVVEHPKPGEAELESFQERLKHFRAMASESLEDSAPAGRDEPIQHSAHKFDAAFLKALNDALAGGYQEHVAAHAHDDKESDVESSGADFAALHECRMCRLARHKDRLKRYDGSPLAKIAQLLAVPRGVEVPPGGTVVHTESGHDMVVKNLSDISVANESAVATTAERISHRLPQSSPLAVFNISSQGLHSEHMHVLLNIPVASAFPAQLKPKDLIVVDSNALLTDALKTLSENYIQAAFVRNVSTGHICGFFDIRDGLRLIFSYVFDNEKQSDALKKIVHAKVRDVAKSTLFTSSMVMPAPWTPLCEYDSFFKLLLFLQLGALRVPITNLRGSLMGIASQLDAIRLLYLEREMLVPKSLLNCQIADSLAMVKKEDVMTCKPTDSTWEAFQRLLKYNISALVCLDDEGRLTCTLSVHHTKGINASTLSWILLPVAKFVQQSTPEQTLPYHTCLPSTSFEDVLKSIVENGCHHIYVVDENGVFVGMVSLRDLISTYLHSIVIKSDL